MENNLNQQTEDTHPLSINIRKFQRYNFEYVDYTDILFFEWLFVLNIGYGYQDFYKSDAKARIEIGLKRTKLENARKKFEKLGILTIEVKGMPSVRHYKIEFDALLTKLDQIYKEEFVKKMETHFQKFRKKQHNAFLIRKLSNNTKEKSFGKLSVDQLIINYCDNIQLIMVVCQDLRIEAKTLTGYLAKFGTHIKTKGDFEYNEKDFKGHFYNWLKIQIAERRSSGYRKISF